MAQYRSPLTVTLRPSSFLKYGPMIPPAHKAQQTVSFDGCNGVLTYTSGLASLKMRQFFVDVAIQPEVRFIAKQNSLMKIGNNGNLLLGPFDESTPCLMIGLKNCQTKLRINCLTAVKSFAILESNANLNSIPEKHCLQEKENRPAYKNNYDRILIFLYIGIDKFEFQ
ncbi:alpha-2 adrenergic receptor [Trichonephila clavipes]|uniref:Alpha-2 adrenergic receptor n=1 Tax=Trichonephila clavipes TaxID=2585209 RepID=A0A8X6W2B5_TRICX|nr:alpha-2 adrenergic receptor [Trichonephila clavipes]